MSYNIRLAQLAILLLLGCRHQAFWHFFRHAGVLLLLNNPLLFINTVFLKLSLFPFSGILLNSQPGQDSTNFL